MWNTLATPAIDEHHLCISVFTNSATPLEWSHPPFVKRILSPICTLVIAHAPWTEDHALIFHPRNQHVRSYTHHNNMQIYTVAFLWISVHNGIGATTMFCVFAYVCMWWLYANELYGVLSCGYGSVLLYKNSEKRNTTYLPLFLHLMRLRVLSYYKHCHNVQKKQCT